MKVIQKYLLFAFLVENVVVQTSLLGMYSDYIFYSFLTIGLILMLTGGIFKAEAFKKFTWVYMVILLYFAYEFTIGSVYSTQQSMLYILSKFVTFGIVIMGVNTNEYFYKGKGIYWLAIVMSFFLLYGLLTGGQVRSGGRMLAGFTNENTAGAMGAMTVGIMLFYMKGRKWDIFKILVVLVGFYGVLAGGSRAGFLVLGLFVFFRYGINLKTVGFILIFIFFATEVLPAMGVHTVGIQRLLDTYNGIEGTNRDHEREAAEWMIAQRPYIGWGFYSHNVGYAATLSELGSHNGYLEIFKQMGYPFGIFYFCIIVVELVKCYFAYRKHKSIIDMFLAYSILTMFYANYEGLFVGVHEFGTNMFFFTLAMASAHRYALQHN